jgi:hypothetical protein
MTSYASPIWYPMGLFAGYSGRREVTSFSLCATDEYFGPWSIQLAGTARHLMVSSALRHLYRPGHSSPGRQNDYHDRGNLLVLGLLYSNSQPVSTSNYGPQLPDRRDMFWYWLEGVGVIVFSCSFSFL